MSEQYSSDMYMRMLAEADARAIDRTHGLVVKTGSPVVRKSHRIIPLDETKPIAYRDTLIRVVRNANGRIRRQDGIAQVYKHMRKRLTNSDYLLYYQDEKSGMTLAPQGMTRGVYTAWEHNLGLCERFAISDGYIKTDPKERGWWILTNAGKKRGQALK